MKKLLSTALLLCAIAALAFAGCSAPANKSYDGDGGHAADSVTSSSECDDGDRPIKKVILLAGGDNCLGYGYSRRLCDTDLRTDVSAQKYEEYKRGYERVGISYLNMLKPDTIDGRSDGFVSTGFGAGYSASGFADGAFGPELGIAEYLDLSMPDDDFCIVKFSGGRPSTMFSHWNVDGGAYYTKMLEFFDGVLSKDEGCDYEICSFCFVQGENDARYLNETYAQESSDFIDAVRSHFDEYAPTNGIAFIDCAISPYSVGYKRINDAKRALAESDGRNYYIDTVAAELDGERDNTDRIHYDAISQLKLGNLIGRAVRDSLDFRLDDAKRQEIPLSKISNELPNADGYRLETYCDGLPATSYWKFDKIDRALNISVDVFDGYLTDGDGIAVDLRFASGEAMRLFVRADGTAEIGGKHKAKAICKANCFGNGKDVSGYSVEIAATLDDPDVSVSFSLVNVNRSVAERRYTELGAGDGADTFMTIEGEELVAGAYAGCGKTLGNGGPFKCSYGWNLARDDGTDGAFAYYASGERGESIVYFKDVYSTDFYAEADICIDSIASESYNAKIGFKVITGNRTGVTFYLDVWRRTLIRTAFSYELTTQGASAGIYAVENFDGDRSFDSDGYIKLSVCRRGDRIAFCCNGDEVIVLVDNECGLGRTPAYCGIIGIDADISVANYRAANGMPENDKTE